MNNLSALDIYETLVTTANIISRTKYASYFSLKGGTVLISKMFENNRQDLFRMTRDIDVHCSSKDIWNSFCSDFSIIMNNNNAGYRYTITKRRAEAKGFVSSDSLQIRVDLPNGGTTIIGMDMNIKSDSIIDVEFNSLLNMSTYSIYTMLSDKIVSISSESIYRRIKDLYDLCVIISMYDINLDELLCRIRIKHPDKAVNLKNMITSSNMNDLRHAYEKFTGILNKPDFEYIIGLSQRFLYPIYKKNIPANCIWRRNISSWESCIM